MTNKDVLIFGKNNENISQPVSITGAENNQVKVISLEDFDLYGKILKELKKFNINMAGLTGTYFTKADVESYKKRL